MGAPLPPEILTPSGQPAYLNPYRGTYTTSRSYARRMQQAYARGLTQAEARGHRIITPSQGRPLTEGYWRSLQRRYIKEINERTWRNAPRRMQTDGRQRKDPRIFRQDIIDVIVRFDQGYRDPTMPGAQTWNQWIEQRLESKLFDLRESQDYSNNSPGRSDWEARPMWWVQAGNIVQPGFIVTTPPPIEFWYYH